jgi:hypothetical protein
MINVVMLGHRARTGKDSLTAEMIRRYPKTCYRYAFADKLKSVVADLYDFSPEQMYGDLKDVEDTRYPNNMDDRLIIEKQPMGFGDTVLQIKTHTNPDYKPYLTPRRILQIFGQQQRAIYPDIWAQYVFNQIEKEHREHITDDVQRVVFIADFRFPNEFNVARRWRDLGSGRKLYCIKLMRPEMPTISGQEDISETALTEFEYWEWSIMAPNLSTLFLEFESWASNNISME